ncbi:MAG: phosphoribosylformylglycinamidine synthase subunit PurS [bacterium]|jgi:phosphoribosylformylglycinamidine synthase PurS subunit
MVQARVFVTLKKSVLDPQGSVVRSGLVSLGYREVQDVRVGKYLELLVAAPAAEAEKRVREMCEKLLANSVIEEYSFEIAEVGE